MNNKSIIACTGAPRSGLKVLATCLQVLGFPTSNHIQPDPETIDRLLLQDLGQPAGSLPYDWMASEAYSRAKERIGKFISQTGTLPDKPLQVSLNALTLPLWLDMFKKHKIKVKLIHILRHPYEVALSLQSNQNMDLHQAHILWLSHIREALRALNELDYSSVTFDQLLADPVSTLNTVFGSSLTSVLRSLTSDLSDLVQPGLKTHHASNLSDADKEKFKPYAKLYDQLRATQYASSALNSEDQRIKIFGSSEIDLIDSLLNAIGMLEDRRHHTHCSLPVDSFHLYATITFPTTSKNGAVVETIPLMENQWQKISLLVPDPIALKNTPIDFIFLNRTGTVNISSIHLVDKAHSEILWQCNDADSFAKIKISGQAIRLAHRNQLSLAVLDQNARICIDPGHALKDCPLDIVIWIKVSPGNENFGSLLKENLCLSAPNASAINDYLTNVLKTMTSMGAFHQSYKTRSEEFKKISTEDDKSLIKAKTFWGATMHLLPQNEVVSSKIYSFGLFEPELCSFFSDFIFQGATVLDVGAHIGLFSMLSSELAGDSGRVFAFEPTPSTREVLMLNLKPYKQAIIVPKLAWHEKTELDFHDLGIQFSAFNTATSDRLGPEQKKKAKDTLIKVEAVTLDYFCREQEIRPDLIKIDAESAEMQVLMGMTSLMDRARPVVTIEVGDMDSTLKDGVPRSREILGFAMSYDYISIRPVAGRYEGHEVKEHYDYDNIIMVPREKLPVRRPLGTVVVQRGRFF